MRSVLGPSLLFLGLTACGTAAKQGMPPSSPEPAEAPAAFEEADSAGSPGRSPSEQAYHGDEAPAPEGEADTALSERAPEVRPGLGTSWGESRFSHVHSVAFHREHPSSPDAVTALYYNDARGVHAMSRDGFVGANDAIVSVARGAFSVQLVDADGDALPGTRHAGRSYAVGEHGDRYQIRIDNHTGHRVEVVATVDGLDVIDGQPGSFSKRGYLIDAYDTLRIEGFRTSDEEVASFRFGTVADSYASRQGSSRNVGVIGVAFFAERGDDWDWSRTEVRRRETADPFPSRYAEPPRRRW